MHKPSTHAPTLIPVPYWAAKRGCVAYLVLGDSMDDANRRGIRSGDYALAGPSEGRRDGHVYIVEVPELGLAIKRLRLTNGRWILTSDNPAYPTWRWSNYRIVAEVYGKISFQEV